MFHFGIHSFLFWKFDVGGIHQNLSDEFNLHEIFTNLDSMYIPLENTLIFFFYLVFPI
jgi:hypothetical protein